MDVHDRGGIGPQEALSQVNDMLKLSADNSAFPASLAEGIEAKGDALKQADLSRMLAAMASGALAYSTIDDIRFQFSLFTGATLEAAITAK